MSVAIFAVRWVGTDGARVSMPLIANATEILIRHPRKALAGTAVAAILVWGLMYLLQRPTLDEESFKNQTREFFLLVRNDYQLTSYPYIEGNAAHIFVGFPDGFVNKQQTANLLCGLFELFIRKHRLPYKIDKRLSFEKHLSGGDSYRMRIVSKNHLQLFWDSVRSRRSDSPLTS
jgi:hypothetical protein